MADSPAAHLSIDLGVCTVAAGAKLFHTTYFFFFFFTTNLGVIVKEDVILLQ